MQTDDTGADLVTNFISNSIVVMWPIVRMTELQAMRVALASNEKPTDLVARQCVTYEAGMLLYKTPLNNETPCEQSASSSLSFFLFLPSSSIFYSL
jgi:hypothetical protein